MQPSDIKIGQRYRWNGREGILNIPDVDDYLRLPGELSTDIVTVVGISSEDNIEILDAIDGPNGLPWRVHPNTLSPLEEGANDANPQD